MVRPMNRLSNNDRCRVLACLVEGNSIRATERITGITKKAVTRLGVELGEACERFADKVMVNLPLRSNPVRRDLEPRRRHRALQ
jgi:hypothetical protein